MITKETTHHTTHSSEKACEGKKCCKGCNVFKGIIGILTCAAAIIAMIYAICSYRAVQSLSGGTSDGSNPAQQMLDFTIAQNGGKANFEKLMNFYSSSDYVDNVTPQIDAMTADGGSDAGDTGTPSPSPTSTLDSSTIETLLSNAHYFGNKDAKIIVLEYSDLLCPFCKRHYNDQTVETVVANHPDDVVLVFKNFPLPSLHPTAPLGAKGLYCAGKIGGDEAFYNFLPKAIATDDFTDANVLELAKSIGLNEAEFTSCYSSSEASNAVDAEVSEGSSLFGINGTPGNVVLNRETGKYIVISGAYPVSEFENAVSQLLN